MQSERKTLEKNRTINSNLNKTMEKFIISEKRKSFQLDLEDALSPPPMSFSAPDLSTRCVLPFKALRNAVSSTELLHERAMARFYKAVELEEQTKNKRITTKSEHNNIPYPSHDRFNPEKQITKEHSMPDTIKPPEIFIKSDSIEDREYKYSSRRPSQDSEASDNKWQHMSFEEDYTASTVSSEDEYSEEGSLNGDMDRSHYLNEEDTYNPRDKQARPSPVKETVDDEEESEREMLKPLPLPDPNFVPKPILKRREPDLVETKISQDNGILKSEGKLKSEDKPKKVEKPKKEEKMTIFKKLTKMPVQKPFPFPKLLNKKEPQTKLVKNPEIDTNKTVKKADKIENKISEEGRTVIDYYGSIVKEYGKQKKSTTPLYLNTDDLKTVAEKQLSESKDDAEKKISKLKKIAAKKSTSNQLVSGKDKTSNSVEKKSRPKQQPKSDKSKLDKNETTPIKAQENKSPMIGTQQIVLTTTERATIVIPINYKELEEKAKVNVRSAIDYMVDVCLLMLAFWVYFFKDERLAIPFLTLIIYRQLQETLLFNIPEWVRSHTPSWLKKKTS